MAKSAEWGRVLKEAAEGRSLRNLADEIGFAHTSFLNWTKGLIPSSSEDVRKIADTLKVPREAFLKAADYNVRDEDLAWDAKHYTHLVDSTNTTESNISGNPLTERTEGRTNNGSPAPPEREMTETERILSKFGKILDDEDERAISSVKCGWETHRNPPRGASLREIIGHDYAIVAEGDSMLPLFEEGTVLYIKVTNNEPIEEEPNVILVNGEPTCAYVAAGDWGKYILYKENGEYEEREVDADDCFFQGVVVEHNAKPPRRKRRNPA